MKNVADHVTQKCGGPAATAKLTGRNVATVYRWAYPKERGGYGGHVPDEDKLTLLREAPLVGIELTWDDFNPLADGEVGQ